jgi:hypothetical protein
MKNDVSHILQTIAKYDLTPKETAAYKVAAIYEHLLKKMFPNYRHICGLGKDPRTSLIFRHAWKVIEEHGHEMTGKDDYKVYVMAQLKVFKTYLDRGEPVLINPNCLSGDGAWARFKLYEKRYEQSKAFQTVEAANIQVNSDDRIVKELKKTKDYFFIKFKRHDPQDIISALDDRSLLRWVVMKNVSGYYPHMSPLVKKWLVDKKQTVSEYFGHSLDVYSKGITPAAYDYFNQEFTYEFS